MHFEDYCSARGHTALQPHLLKWWVADRLDSVKAQTVQVQLAAVVTTAQVGGAPSALCLALKSEAHRLNLALDEFRVAPAKAAGWLYEDVKRVTDNINWSDRFESHQGLCVLLLFVTGFRVSEATHVRVTDCSQWREPASGKIMLHIVIREMKNMARGQHHVRAVPWEYLSIGPRIMEHVNKHGLPRDSFLLRCPPMGTAPWEAKPNGPYTQAGECVKRLFGPQAQTHGGRRGCIQLLRSLGASDTEVNEFARWK